MTSWIEGKAYVDHKGNMYKVMPSGSRDDLFRAKYCKPHTAGWHSVFELKLKTTAMEAQRDLDELARKNGWRAAN